MPPVMFHVDGGIRLEAAEVAVTVGIRLAGLGLGGDLRMDRSPRLDRGLRSA